MGKLGRESLSPQELASFQDSISSLATSRKDLAVDNSLDGDAVLQLLSQHVSDDSVAETSQGIIRLLLWLLKYFYYSLQVCHEGRQSNVRSTFQSPAW